MAFIQSFHFCLLLFSIKILFEFEGMFQYGQGTEVQHFLQFFIGYFMYSDRPFFADAADVIKWHYSCCYPNFAKPFR